MEGPITVKAQQVTLVNQLQNVLIASLPEGPVKTDLLNNVAKNANYYGSNIRKILVEGSRKSFAKFTLLKKL